MRNFRQFRPFVLALIGILGLTSALHAQPYEVYCQDGIDNDGDNRIDTNPFGTPPGNLGPDSDCQCFDDVVPGNLQCTANDLSFVVVGLGVQSDGCVNASDTVSVKFGSKLETTGANRYDIGMWVALDGGNARTGKCARQILVPAITPVNTTPTAAQLNSGNGPFRNADNGDLCADLDKTDNPDGTATFNARYNFKDLNSGPAFSVQPEYQLSCGSAANGALTISTCIGYEQNAGGACNNLNQAIPGTGSKCRCQGGLPSSIPVPNLALSCGCTAAPNSGVVTCDVTYSNNGSGTCIQVSSTGETEFACGTARYLRFKTSYPVANGSLTTLPSTCTPTTSGTTTANCNAGPGRGTATDNGTGTITWLPKSDNGAGSGTIGWIGTNESEKMRFTYTQSSPGPQTLSFPTIAEWADNASFTGAVQQTALSCGPTLTTPVTLQSFRAHPDGDEMVIDWSTSTEAGTVGFDIVAETAEGEFRLNDNPVPSQKVDSLEPLAYRLRVPLEGLEGAQFFVAEVSTSGAVRRHGPFAAGARRGEIAKPEPTDWPAILSEHKSASAERGRSERRSVLAAPPGNQAAEFAGGGPRVRPSVDLAVSQEGVQRLTYEALMGAGIDFTGVKVADFALESGGAEVPITVGGARTFGPGSYVEFVGKALDTLYTDTNVYTLRAERRGVRVAVDATAPNPAASAVPHYVETARVERNLTYSFGSPNGDPWFERYLIAFSQPTSASFTVSVDHLAVGAASSALRLELWGVTNWTQSPDHHLVATFNGVTVADDIFDGLIDHPIAARLPAGIVTEGANTLTLTQPADTGVAWDYIALESYAIDYPRTFVAQSDRLRFSAAGQRFQVGGFTSPNIVIYRVASNGTATQVTGGVVTGAAGSFTVSFPGSPAVSSYTLSAVSALAAPGIAVARELKALDSGAAQLLIISHPDFVSSLGALVTARVNEGFSVKVVDLRDVYARNSYGIRDPQAIRRYVAYAQANLGTRYVLLVGGDTYDYRGYASTGALSFVPSIYAATGPYVNFAPADPLIGDTNGDGVPDLPVGRFPVRTAAELESMIWKTLAYGSKPYGQTAVMAADSFDAPSATSFAVISDGLAAKLSEDWSVTRAYIDQDGVVLAKSNLIAAINNGVALTTFIGHSGPTAWTFQGLMRSTDAGLLENSDAPTLVFQLGCWNSYYVSPTSEGLAQRFLLAGDRGAAVVLGATTLTETDSDRAFGPIALEALVQPGMTVGDAILGAKRALATEHPEMRDVLVGFTILGDPTVVVEP
ncbi:MAG: C25 family cysteine peptidase [Thermoanaerobaculia bacterium]